MRTRAIIVAVDGTASSNAAVRWASAEAQRRRLPLRITYVVDWDWSTARYDFTGNHFEEAQRLAVLIPGAAAALARDIAPAVEIDSDLLIGHPVDRLLAAAENAELLVLGSRGRGGFAGLLLGSVSRRVATHAPCPVVVVRGREDVADGPVTAGIDGSASADRVLETAFNEAAERGCPLTVIRAYQPPVPMYLADASAPEFTTPGQDAEERATLSEQLAPWQAKFPAVTVEAQLSHDSPAQVLTDVSYHSQLVIIGSRGHGMLAGALRGSVGLHLLHHAACPVFIVRQHHREPWPSASDQGERSRTTGPAGT